MNRWLSGIWKTRRYRSLAGIALGLVILATLLGILACLKTPVGNPERASIDPRLTGIWLSGNPRPSESAAIIWIFEPYDARTWLITAIEFGHASGNTEPSAVPSSVGSDVLHILESLREHPPGAASVTLSKTWLADLGGRTFLVQEPKAIPSRKSEFRPEFWVFYRVQLQGARLLLSQVKESTEHLDQATSRRKAEGIIARHAADANFYSGTTVLYSVPHAGYDDVKSILKHIGFDP
ncbi:MAG TPA: hypothetical protein VJ738_17675 [Steroidobacteraceae bacterium]|nr:hypothetical protein [Steroidobacteraceae bacterium]